MTRTLAPLAALLLTLCFAASASAQSKQALDDGFAHVKHGQLFLCANQGAQHSIGSHTGWARGQSAAKVRKEIVSQMLQAYLCLVEKPTTKKSDVVSGFAYIKQGVLILTGKTGPQHSIGSHSNWANGQSDESVRKATAAMLEQARGPILGGL